MIRIVLFTSIPGTPSIPYLEHIIPKTLFIINISSTTHIWCTLGCQYESLSGHIKFKRRENLKVLYKKLYVFFIRNWAEVMNHATRCNNYNDATNKYNYM